jgi:3-hydroxyacyl-[acyl-carrier-protein] dehydratase
MRLQMIDRIVDLQAGREITAIKCLSLTEEYLQDHFPRFPIMPGVLMLEAMYQASAWLVRATDGFRNSLVTLAEANNVKYSDFVEPGETLLVTAELTKHEGSVYRLQCQGEVGDKVAARGRLVLQTARLDQYDPRAEPIDAQMIHSLQRTFRVLYPSGDGQHGETAQRLKPSGHVPQG